MRNAKLPLLLLLLPLIAPACDLSRATQPNAPSIAVLVHDDAGAPVSRASVVVTSSPAARLSAETHGDGTVAIAVAGAGTYQVSIVVGLKYVITPALSKAVVVGPNNSATVEFTLYRSGYPVLPRPEPEPPPGD